MVKGGGEEGRRRGREAMEVVKARINSDEEAGLVLRGAGAGAYQLL